jgi:heme exporter protein A
MLEVLNLECVRGERQLFAGLCFGIRPGEIVHLAGRNGSGKTSLLRILCGLHTASAGSVHWKGRPINAIRDEYHRDLVFVGHLNGLKDELSPLENLSISGMLAGTATDADRLHGALRAFGVDTCADLPVRHLSQGQRRRVSLARLALSGASPLWILDEPFNALDTAAVARLQRLLAAHATAGGMVIVTSHLELAIDGVAVKKLDLDLRGQPA